MARRDQGTGSVYRRGSDGRWIAQIENGWTPSGRRRYTRRTAGSETAARRILKDLIAEQAAGQTSIDPRTTVRTWCEEWLGGVEKRAKPTTLDAYRSAARVWIVPTLGRRRLSALTVADLDKLTAAVRASGSATHALGVAKILRTCLKSAVVAGHNVPRPVMAAPLPRHGLTDRQAIPTEAAARMLAAAAHKETWPPLGERPPTDWTSRESIEAKRRWDGDQLAREEDISRIMAALLQGIRPQEALGLTWDCVDLDRDLMDVSWQLQDIKPDATLPDDFEMRRLVGSKALVRPKSRSGVRTLPIVPWMAAALADWRGRQGPNPHGLVWTRADGRPIEGRTDLEAWKALERHAGVAKGDGHYVRHEARHTTASLLAELEVPVPVIIAIVGHSSYATTMRYTHVGIEQARQALQQVAERLQITD
jgi:integrase